MTTRFTKARRLGRDEEETADIAEEMRELIADPEADFSDLIAMLVEAAPEKVPEIGQTMREIGEDSRGIHAWARDKRELRRHAKRFGRDQPPKFEGRPNPGGTMEGEDRRLRMAGDRMAYDSSPAGRFARLFPNAAKVERV
jgi:hypothetical protein